MTSNRLRWFDHLALALTLALLTFGVLTVVAELDRQYAMEDRV